MTRRYALGHRTGVSPLNSLFLDENSCQPTGHRRLPLLGISPVATRYFMRFSVVLETECVTHGHGRELQNPHRYHYTKGVYCILYLKESYFILSILCNINTLAKMVMYVQR